MLNGWYRVGGPRGRFFLAGPKDEQTSGNKEYRMAHKRKFGKCKKELSINSDIPGKTESCFGNPLVMQINICPENSIRAVVQPVERARGVWGTATPGSPKALNPSRPQPGARRGRGPWCRVQPMTRTSRDGVCLAQERGSRIRSCLESLQNVMQSVAKHLVCGSRINGSALFLRLGCLQVADCKYPKKL